MNRPRTWAEMAQQTRVPSMVFSASACSRSAPNSIRLCCCCNSQVSLGTSTHRTSNEVIYSLLWSLCMELTTALAKPLWIMERVRWNLCFHPDWSCISIKCEFKNRLPRTSSKPSHSFSFFFSFFFLFVALLYFCSSPLATQRRSPLGAFAKLQRTHFG